LKDNEKLKAKLVDYVQDAHAMELNLETMLESMIKAAKDTKTKAMLEAHLQQTHDHKHRLDQRLEALDSHPSIRKTGESVAVALPKGLIDRFRSDQPGKIARDGYVAEAVEIAAYSLLEQLALRCGDEFIELGGLEALPPVGRRPRCRRAGFIRSPSAGRGYIGALVARANAAGAERQRSY